MLALKGVVFLLVAAATVHQQGVYADDAKLAGYARTARAAYDANDYAKTAETLEAARPLFRVTDAKTRALMEFMLGDSYFALQKYDAAIEAMDRAMAGDPEWRAKGYPGQGLCLQALKRHDEADEKYAKAYEFDRDVKFLMLRGNNRLEQKRYDDALAHFRQAAKEKPDAVEAFIGAARVSIERNDYAKARGILDKALKGRPHALAYKWRAICFANLSQVDRMMDDLNRSLKLNPGDGEALYLRGTALQKMGRKGEAERDLAAAARLGVK